MIDRFHKHEMPDLKAFPSAEAQDCAPIVGRAPTPKRPKRRSLTGTLLKLSAVLLLMIALVIGGVAYLMSQGAISSEQLRAQLELQLTSLLGPGQAASVGNAKIAIGKNGLLSIDAADVKILQDETLKLGTAGEVNVKVKAMPLLSGKVVAQSLTIKGASVALDLQSDASATTVPSDDRWPAPIDFGAGLKSLGLALQRLAAAVSDAGLESINLEDTELIGFEKIGLGTRRGKLLKLSLRKDDSVSKSLLIDAVVQTENNELDIAGNWQTGSDGSSTLTFSVNGMEFSDLWAPSRNGETNSAIVSPVRIDAIFPFLPDGTPQQAVARMELGNGTITIANESLPNLISGKLNFRVLPSTNRLVLERSSIDLETNRIIVVGELGRSTESGGLSTSKSSFSILVEEFLAFGMLEGKAAPKASFSVSGEVDHHSKLIAISKLGLTTPSGILSGTARADFTVTEPHLSLAVNIPKMPVDELKQFWPSIIAPNTRKWIKTAIQGGTVTNAVLKADFPPGTFGKDSEYTAQNLSIDLSLSNTSVKTTGDLPDIQNAAGVVSLRGNETNISVRSGKVNVGKLGSLNVGQSTFVMGDYDKDVIDAKMGLALSGPASALAGLSARKPLNFASKLKITPSDIGGQASASITAYFGIGKAIKLAKKAWSVQIKLAKGSTQKLVPGSKISSLNADINLTPSSAKVDGTALIDGVPTKLALVESLDGSGGGSRKLTLSLDNKDRKRMGFDTGSVLDGTVDVRIIGQRNGVRKVEADLRKAKLDFPWIGWSKGKGVPATAVFDVKQSNGTTTLQNLRLKGKGFSAHGSLVVDKSGLRSAKLSKIKLNKTDDFDVAATRTKGGYSVSVNARAYDGRALIRSFLSNEATKKAGGSSVLVKARVARLTGFGGQVLSNVKIRFAQRGSRVTDALVESMAPGNAPTVFALNPVSGGLQTEISTSNAGSVLRFLDLYSKIRGGTIRAKLVKDASQVFRGQVVATNFTLLGEPRLAQLLQKPRPPDDLPNSERVVRELKKLRTDKAKIDRLQARVEKGRGFLNISKGRLTGGDASAAFSGRVYDQNNQMNIKGTYLPGRGLNRLVSKIPILGLAFGGGKVNGLLGITFKLSGRYGNPKLQVNPLSIIAPGVFRNIFKF